MELAFFSLGVFMFKLPKVVLFRFDLFPFPEFSDFPANLSVSF